MFRRRVKGRSRIGTRAVQTLPSSRGPNIHVIGAMSCEGIVKMAVRRGAYQDEACDAWILEMLNDWTTAGHRAENLVIVCNNAPVHLWSKNLSE